MKQEKHRDVTFNDTEMVAFEKLKHALITPPLLTLPKKDLPFLLNTDTCDRQVGCVLRQHQTDNAPLRTIRNWSRTLLKPERNYDASQQKCLEVVWEPLTPRHYLKGSLHTPYGSRPAPMDS